MEFFHRDKIFLNSQINNERKRSGIRNTEVELCCRKQAEEADEKLLTSAPCAKISSKV